SDLAKCSNVKLRWALPMVVPPMPVAAPKATIATVAEALVVAVWEAVPMALWQAKAEVLAEEALTATTKILVRHRALRDRPSHERMTHNLAACSKASNMPSLSWALFSH